jgi:hypothetical protein
MTNIVCWKWDDPGYVRGDKLLPEYYNILYAMLERNITLPVWDLIVPTDDTTGLNPNIVAVPQPSSLSIRSPHGNRFPACYRRLWNFSRDAQYLFGNRFLCIDVDVIIVRNIDAMLTRPEKFVGWTDPDFKWEKIAGGLYYMQAGAHPEVWDDFDPKTSPAIAKADGRHGSDQGWISHKLYPPDASFGRKDGAWYAKWIPPGLNITPAEVKIVSTPGSEKPWHESLQTKHPWIKHHWRL